MNGIKFKLKINKPFFDKIIDFENVININFEEQSVSVNIVYDALNESEVIKFHFSEVEFVKYTGLKDKNGREIYEGDILRLKAKKGYEYLGDVGVIRMSYSAYVIGTSTGEYLFIYFDEVEIIGNIYENPELLEVNK